MHVKMLLFLGIISFTSNLSAQLYEKLENNAADLLISLSEHNPNYIKDIEILKSNLFIDINADELEKRYSTTATEFDSLKNHFAEFENELKNISLDSALVLFNYWYLHFSNTFYNYAEEKFFSSEKEKIILFSTSMSCYCTLEMCRRQTAQLIDLCRFYQIDYWIIDSYENNDLQIKYETLFVPSVILFDENNNPVLKIQYDEEMISKLVNFFNNKNFEQMKG